MKLLSIAVPCYNSAAYMESCIESLLPGGEDVEILIIDDGSTKDNTGEIADRLEREHPTIVRAIHQENGGHGEAVNAGIRNATGIYFKVVDSDDHLDKEAYIKVMEKLREFEKEENQIDLLISNYVYDYEGAPIKRVTQYKNALPVNEIFSLNKMGHFRKGQYILMHSCIYRTKLLRECGISLPKHTFYVDNIYVFEPLPFVKKAYYLDVNFYKYYIGRADQSVNEKVMIGRIDQQIRINKIMYDYFSGYRKSDLYDAHLYGYMYNYLEIMVVVSSVLAILEGSEENLLKKQELWDYMKEKDEELYKEIRGGAFGIILNINNGFGHFITKAAYKIARKIFQFN